MFLWYSPWGYPGEPLNYANSKETEPLGENSCRQKCLDKSLFSVTDTGISSNFKIKHSIYANWNNERINILPSWSYHVLQLFPTKQLQFISSPYFSIQHFKDSHRIYKNSNLPSISLVKDIFYCNHKPYSMGVQELNMCNLCYWLTWDLSMFCQGLIPSK